MFSRLVDDLTCMLFLLSRFKSGPTDKSMNKFQLVVFPVNEEAAPIQKAGFSPELKEKSLSVSSRS